MSVTVEAVYENGVLKLKELLPFPEQEAVRVTLEPVASVATDHAERTPVKGRRMTEVEQRMLDDLNWAAHAPEVQGNPEHYGQFVVVQNRQILGFGRDRMALTKEVEQKAGIPAQEQVVVIVHSPESYLVEIPH